MPVINTILLLDTAKNELSRAVTSGNPMQIASAVTKILKIAIKRCLENLPSF